MKIKGLLMGMAAFLGFALIGCSDDVIDVNNQEQQVSKEPAYLSVTFSANSTSSRSTADDANNQGDKDGNAEDSGHENLGTDNENAINSALIVIQSTNGASGYTKLYEFGTGEGQSELKSTTTTNSEIIYTLAKDIELSANPFDVLVVANPNDNIYAGLTDQQVAEVKRANGSRGDDIIAQLFTNIKDGSYAVEENDKALYNYAGTILDITEAADGNTSKTLNGIMMTNKANFNITLSSTTANVATVELERVASKITYRHYGAKENNGKYEIVAAPSTNEEGFYQDVYPITAPIAGTVEPITYEYTDAQGKTVTINEATITDENDGEKTIYVTVNEGLNQITGVYTQGEAEDGTITWTKDENATLPNYNDVTFKANYEETTWFVKLEGYALVNLSKSVYNVRHTTYDGGYVPFGVLNGSNFLYTPNWKAGINNVTFKADGTFDNIANTNAWFFNTLKQVSDESLETTQDKYFTTFASSLGGVDDVQDVTGDGTYKDDEEEKHQHSKDNGNLSKIGELLAYCLENSTDIKHQTHGLSTGITFKAKICTNPDGTGAIGTFYRFQGHLFQTIKEIQDAYSKVYPDLSKLNENSNAEALKEMGVSKYSDGTCYYYTTEIKHYDNNNPLVLGNMEFAIMRNNIYSLAVTAIEKIGDPYVDPIPSTPDEVAKPKLTVEAKIMPWIVRYHDIEFNK